jgi:hypothetical protein
MVQGGFKSSKKDFYRASFSDLDLVTSIFRSSSDPKSLTYCQSPFGRGQYLSRRTAPALCDCVVVPSLELSLRGMPQRRGRRHYAVAPGSLEKNRVRISTKPIFFILSHHTSIFSFGGWMRILPILRRSMSCSNREFHHRGTPTQPTGPDRGNSVEMVFDTLPGLRIGDIVF